MSNVQTIVNPPTSVQEEFLKSYAQRGIQKRYQQLYSKTLQNPYFYILSVVAAFTLYHLDSRNLLNCFSRDRTTPQALSIEEDIAKEQNFVERHYILIASILIVTLLLAIKKVVSRRKALDSIQKKVEWIDGYDSSSKVRNLGSKADSEEKNKYLVQGINACKKISQEEYQYQSKTFTQSQVLQLVNSQKYKELKQNKGDKVEAWNWQVYERNQGILPPDEKELEIKDFDLQSELFKVDQEVKKPTEPTNIVAQRASLPAKSVTMKGSPLKASPTALKHLKTPSTSNTLQSPLTRSATKFT